MSNIPQSPRQAPPPQSPRPEPEKKVGFLDNLFGVSKRKAKKKAAQAEKTAARLQQDTQPKPVTERQTRELTHTEPSGALVAIVKKAFGIVFGVAPKKVGEGITEAHLEAHKDEGIKKKELAMFQLGEVSVPVDFIFEKLGEDLGMEFLEQSALLEDLARDILGDEQLAQTVAELASTIGTGKLIRGAIGSAVSPKFRNEKIRMYLNVAADILTRVQGGEVELTKREIAVTRLAEGLTKIFQKEAIRDKLKVAIMGMPHIKDIADVDLAKVFDQKDFAKAFLSKMKGSVSPKAIDTLLRDLAPRILEVTGKDEEAVKKERIGMVLEPLLEAVIQQSPQGKEAQAIKEIIVGLQKTLEDKTVQGHMRQAIKDILPSAKEYMEKFEAMEEMLGKNVVQELIGDTGMLAFLRNEIGADLLQNIAREVVHGLVLSDQSTMEFAEGLKDALVLALKSDSKDDQMAVLLEQLAISIKQSLKNPDTMRNIRMRIMDYVPQEHKAIVERVFNQHEVMVRLGSALSDNVSGEILADLTDVIGSDFIQVLKQEKEVPDMRKELRQLDTKEEMITVLKAVGKPKEKIPGDIESLRVRIQRLGDHEIKKLIKQDLDQQLMEPKKRLMRALSEAISQSPEGLSSNRAKAIKNLFIALQNTLKDENVRGDIKEAIRGILPSSRDILSHIEGIEKVIGKDLVMEVIKDKGLLFKLREAIGGDLMQSVINEIAGKVLDPEFATEDMKGEIIDALLLALQEDNPEEQKAVLIQNLGGAIKEFLSSDGVRTAAEKIIIDALKGNEAIKGEQVVNLIKDIEKEADLKLVDALFENKEIKGLLTEIVKDLKNSKDITKELIGSLEAVLLDKETGDAKAIIVKDLLGKLHGLIKNDSAQDFVKEKLLQLVPASEEIFHILSDMESKMDGRVLDMLVDDNALYQQFQLAARDNPDLRNVFAILKDKGLDALNPDSMKADLLGALAQITSGGSREEFAIVEIDKLLQNPTADDQRDIDILSKLAELTAQAKVAENKGPILEKMQALVAGKKPMTTDSTLAKVIEQLNIQKTGPSDQSKVINGLLSGLTGALKTTMANKALTKSLENRAVEVMYAAGYAVDKSERRNTTFIGRMKEKLKIAFSFLKSGALVSRSRREKWLTGFINEKLTEAGVSIPGVPDDKRSEFILDIAKKVLYTDDLVDGRLMRAAVGGFICGNVGLPKFVGPFLTKFIGRFIFNVKVTKQPSVKNKLNKLTPVPGPIPGTVILQPKQTPSAAA